MAMPFMEMLAETLLPTPEGFVRFVELDRNPEEVGQVGYVTIDDVEKELRLRVELWNGIDGRVLQTPITLQELEELADMFSEILDLAKAKGYS